MNRMIAGRKTTTAERERGGQEKALGQRKFTSSWEVIAELS